MHKKIFIVATVLALVLCLTFALAACDDNKGGKNDPVSYSVQAPAASDVFTVSGLPENAREGDTVTFRITLADPADSAILGVTVIPTFALSFDVAPDAEGNYSFTMPASPVEIEVETEVYKEVLDDGVAEYSGVTTLTKNSGTVGLTVEVDHKKVYSLNERLSYVRSSDQSVIPDSAIGEFDVRSHSSVTGDSSGSSAVARVIIPIDTGAISEGTTWLKIHLSADAGVSGAKGDLCVKITVAERIQLSVMRENVKIDFDDYAAPGEDIVVRFYDSSYITNSYIGDDPAPKYIEVKGKVGADGTATFSFDYVVGHEYSIDIYKGKEWYTGALDTQEKQEKVLMTEDDKIQQGSSETGFNQYVDGKLSFVDENVTMSLTVTGTFADANSRPN